MAEITIIPSGSVPAAAARLTQPEQLAAAFLAGRSPRTLEAYAADLADFARWWGEVDTQAATSRLVRLHHGDANATVLAYRVSLLERGLAPATINRRLAALRSMVKLGNLLGLVDWKLLVEGVKTQTYRDTQGPSASTFRAMKRAAASRIDAKGRRDVAILRLLHDVALRRGELVALDLEDLSLKASTIRVVSKGHTQKALMTVPGPTLAALEAWVAMRGLQPGPLFLSFDHRSTGRLTGRGVATVVAAIGVAVGAQVRPHGLRHLAITTVLDRSNGNVRAAQRFSRHRDIRVLGIYDDNLSDMGGQMAALIAE